MEFCSTYNASKTLNNDLWAEKKELDDMKGTVQRYKEKDDTGLQSKIMSLQNALELLNSDLESNDILINNSSSKITDERQVNIEQLETRITDE